ncbi:Cytosolic sulfotransferase 17 [Dichanthelium oligosanthes]|uniref:Sulfotransferase n=1 Tax=Dichanthelium oligosanthes TaxID=888268 RepID=A0A1E5V667_9POAL|nr:Cytosolic sulfotransferase 17 [Dichanthelium oligosanthes]
MSQAMEERSATKSSSEAISSESLDTDLISKLPTREVQSERLFLYKNFWFRQGFVERIMLLQGSFKARHDDIILATNPKCGTTWLKALAFTITNRCHYDFGNHPLLTRHPQEVIPTIDVEIPLNGDLTCIEKLPSPRILATHMPFSLLPEPISIQGCRIVYICRDPKDAFVSRWHFVSEFFGEKNELNVAFNQFCEGISGYGPFWDHCLGYWRESITNSDRVLFLKYEEMMSEPVKFVKALASFLGAPFTSEEQDGGVPEEVVRLCSFKTLSGLNTSQTEVVQRGNVFVKKSAYFRRGEVGDWVNHISEEMGRKLDCIVEEKLKGSGLVF